MSWALVPLIISVFGAISVQINQHFKIDGLTLVFFRSSFVALYLFPFLFFVDWPTNWQFYGLVFTVGLLAIAADIAVFNAARVYGGRLTSMYFPMKMIGGFFLWAIISPSFLPDLWQHQIAFWGVLGCLGVSTFALLIMRGHDMSRGALLAVLPAGVCLTFADSLGKLAMQGLDLLSACIVFGFFIALTSSVVVWPFYVRRQRRKGEALVDENTLKAGSLLGVTYCFIFTLFPVANALAPNPAYVNAIVVLSGVWLMLYHRVRGIPDHASPLAGLLFILAAAGLILFTGMSAP